MIKLLNRLFRGKTIKQEIPEATKRRLPTFVIDREVTDEEVSQLLNLNVNLISDNLSWHKNIVSKRIKLYDIERLRDLNFMLCVLVFSGTVHCDSELILAQWLYFKVKEAIKAGQEFADVTEILNTDFIEEKKFFPHEEIQAIFMKDFEVFEDSEAELKVKLISSLNF